MAHQRRRHRATAPKKRVSATLNIDTPTQPTLTVYFDGACPLCRREIDFYRKRKGANRVAWVNLETVADDGLPGNTTRCDLLRRLHVKDADGELQSGAKAFFAIWRALPAFKILALLEKIPVLERLAEYTYTQFLKIRPKLQEWVSR